MHIVLNNNRVYYLVTPSPKTDWETLLEVKSCMTKYLIIASSTGRCYDRIECTLSLFTELKINQYFEMSSCTPTFVVDINYFHYSHNGYQCQVCVTNIFKTNLCYFVTLVVLISIFGSG